MEWSFCLNVGEFGVFCYCGPVPKASDNTDLGLLLIAVGTRCVWELGVVVVMVELFAYSPFLLSSADIAVELLQKAAPSPIRRLQKKYVAHVSR